MVKPLVVGVAAPLLTLVKSKPKLRTSSENALCLSVCLLVCVSVSLFLSALSRSLGPFLCLHRLHVHECKLHVYAC